jgi:hypothetical protein
MPIDQRTLARYRWVRPTTIDGGAHEGLSRFSRPLAPRRPLTTTGRAQQRRPAELCPAPSGDGPTVVREAGCRNPVERIVLTALVRAGGSFDLGPGVATEVLPHRLPCHPQRCTNLLPRGSRGTCGADAVPARSGGGRRRRASGTWRSIRPSNTAVEKVMRRVEKSGATCRTLSRTPIPGAGGATGSMPGSAATRPRRLGEGGAGGGGDPW